MNKKILIALLSGVVATTMVACNGDSATAGASGGQSGGDTGKVLPADEAFDFATLPQYKLNTGDIRLANGLALTLLEGDYTKYDSLENSISLVNAAGEPVAIKVLGTVDEGIVHIAPEAGGNFVPGTYTLETKDVKLTNGNTVEDSAHTISIASDNTILCSAQEPGDVLTVSGVTYTVLGDGNESQITNDMSGNFCTSHVTSLANLFKSDETKTLTEDEQAKIAKFDTSNVTNLSNTFNGVKNITDLDLKDWDVSKVENLSWAFNNSDFNNNSIESWNVSNVKSFEGTFNDDAAFNQDISEWSTGNATTMSRMFQRAASFNQADLYKWNVSKVKDMFSMFKGATAFSSGLGAWNTESVTNMQGMFEDATAFTGSDSQDWDVSNVTNFTYFAKNSGLVTENGDAMQDSKTNYPHFKAVMTNGGKTVTCDAIPTGAAAYFDNVPYAVVSTVDADYLKNNNICTSHVTSLAKAFKDKTLTDAEKAKIPAFDTHNVTSLYTTFSGTTDIWDLDLSGWNTSNVKTLYGTFNGSNFNNDSISHWDVSNVTYFGSTFANNSDFNKDLSAWKTDSATTMDKTFDHATNFNQNINNWNTSKVTTMEAMFRNAKAFDQDVWNWNTGNVTNMAAIFQDASKFNHGLSDWDVSKVQNMGWMFNNATSFNKEIWKWKVSSANNMQDMFNGAKSYAQGLGAWAGDLKYVENMDRMFKDSAFNESLKGWWSVNQNTSHSEFGKGFAWPEQWNNQ